MTAELAARITAARAVYADYRREADDWRVEPDWAAWALRLAAELGALLEFLGKPSDPGDTARLAEIREVLAHFDWEFHDRQLALERIEQIAGSGA